MNAFFHGNGELGRLGANVLFSLRTDSYAILKESRQLFRAEASFEYNQHAYSIDAPDWSEVVRQRGHLLSFALSQVRKEGTRKVLASIVDPIMRDLERAGPGHTKLIDHLQRITNYGLRDMMHFFAQYSWLEGHVFQAGEEGLERFLHQYPVGLLAFMLAGKRRFNQFSSAFPNIYLANRQAAERNAHGDAHHPHTYWLKRLILTYVEHKENAGEAVRLHNLIQVFACNGQGYDADLIQACLGSLAQANYSNMIGARRSMSPAGDYLQIDDIYLTPRGRHCLRAIFDRFFYLQLIVDDYMLPIPRVVASEFDYGSSDYGYIVLPPRVYTDQARAMIQRKAKQVLLFVEVLNCALACEKKRYASVFERLRAEKVVMPTVTVIRDGVEEELRALNARYNLLSLPLLREYVSARCGDIRGSLEEAYLLAETA